MAKRKTVAYVHCDFADKRSFTEFEVDKALGRAQHKRRGLRGGHVESRYYYCGACDGYHLTHLSRREFNLMSGLVAA